MVHKWQESLPENKVSWFKVQSSLSFMVPNNGHESRAIDMPYGVFPEGIADKAFPAGSPARRRYFYATVKVNVALTGWAFLPAGNILIQTAR
ncbi:MAG: hypothetical protein GXP46_05015 [Deferribacteres bacterium]|nr:hypothetical protein [Deferribacteres bacterium]